MSASVFSASSRMQAVEIVANASAATRALNGFRNLIHTKFINVSRRRAVHRSMQRRLPKDKTHCKNTTNILNDRDFQWDYVCGSAYFEDTQTEIER